jgi:hypothetical protein
MLRRHRLLEHWAREKGSVTRATVSTEGETITVHTMLASRKRGGRKLVVTPDGAAWAPRPRVDNAMVKALARAFRWRKMLDEGVHATLENLARRRGVNATYVTRILRLTLLAPDIVEAILDGRQPHGIWKTCGSGCRWSVGSRWAAPDRDDHYVSACGIMSFAVSYALGSQRPAPSSPHYHAPSRCRATNCLTRFSVAVSHFS